MADDHVLIDQFAIDVHATDDIVDDPSNIAEIRISAAGRDLTTLYDADAGQRRNFLRASATTLAMWFADNWWRLIFEPLPGSMQPDVDWRLRHELASISHDTVWPPIMIHGDGGIIEVGPRIGKTPSIGPISYETPSRKFVRSQTFSEALDDFFAVVCGLFSSGSDIATLNQQLKDLKREREDDDAAAWRRLEAQLGYDPDKAPDNLMKRFAKLAEQFGDAAVSEAASAAPGSQSVKIMESALDAARAGILINRESAGAGDLSGGLRDFSNPWQAAESKAASVRQRLNIQAGPVSSKLLGELFNVNFEIVREAPATAEHLPYAAIVPFDHCERLALHSWPYAVPRRFELARALGDATWEKTPTFAAISDAKTERQKYQRAFAQSFLCPFDRLKEYIGSDQPTEGAIIAAAAHFKVSERLVRTVLINKNVLPREALSPSYESS